MKEDEIVNFKGTGKRQEKAELRLSKHCQGAKESILFFLEAVVGFLLICFSSHVYTILLHFRNMSDNL